MSLLMKNGHFLRKFIKRKFSPCLLKMICLFAATSLYSDEELTCNSLQMQIAWTKPNEADVRFRLYKELLALQVNSYRANGGDAEALASTIHVAATDVDQREKCIGAFNAEEKAIFTSYEELFSLSHRLAIDAAHCNRSFHLLEPLDANAFHKEPLQLHFLQILELEEDLHFPVHGEALLVKEQAAILTGILKLLGNEITAMQVKRKIQSPADMTLEHKELNYYWTTIVNLCHEFLSRLDDRWSQSDYNRLKILNLVLGKWVSFTFPYPGHAPNFIDPFFPFILKHANLELARERFDQIHAELDAWDRNFEWVNLHVKAAKSLLPSNQEKAKACLEQAKRLTEDTLWCYSFSFNRANWNAKQEEARRLVNTEIERLNEMH